MDVSGTHQIIPFGDDLMRLYDSKNGQVILTATRSPGGTWTVAVEDGIIGDREPVQPMDVPEAGEGERPRDAVIRAMVDMALAALPGEGYSTLVPHGLAATP